MSYIHDNDDGTKSFLGDAMELSQIRVALNKQNISIIHEEDALFNSKGKVVDIDFTVDGPNEDRSFALQDMIKYIRPYYKRCFEE